MKKQFTILLILIFILGLAPFNFSNAITQNQIDAEVQIVCTDGMGSWFSGSGTIIDPKGIILTNRHVVEGAYQNTCVIGFIESINQEPNFGTSGNYNLAEVKYKTTSSDMDAAILYLDNPTNKTYPYINIWDSNSDTLQFGDNVEVVGFPSIGGSTITYASGDFSGFGSKIDNTQNYIKTTLSINHGNSGGAAYNLDGLFIGMPTFVLTDINSISYILSVNSIKNWLSGILGSGYQKEIIEQKPIIETPKINIQKDITPPTLFSVDKIIFHGNETGKDISYNNMLEEDSDITAKWPTANDENGVAGYYVYFGTNKNANPVSDGVFMQKTEYNKKFNIPAIYYLIITAKDQYGNISPSVIAQYNYKVYPNWITDNPMQYLLVTNRPTYFYVYDYSNGIKGNLLKEIKFDSSKVQEISVPSNNILIEWNGAQNKDFITKQEIYFDIGSWPIECGGDVYYKIKDKISMSYEEWDACVKRHYNEVKQNQIIGTNLQVNKYYGLQYNYYFTYENHLNEFGGSFNPFVLMPTKKIAYKENYLANRLKGKILLQVESHGEAYYIHHKDGKRYYMANGNEAYRIMRYLGVGITNANLDKVKNDKIFAKKHSGKIFLQVEAHGEAYYIDFDGNAHYLKDGNAAYGIMRDLGLGITNSDLNKISEESL